MTFRLSGAVKRLHQVVIPPDHVGDFFEPPHSFMCCVVIRNDRSRTASKPRACGGEIRGFRSGNLCCHNHAKREGEAQKWKAEREAEAARIQQT